MRLSTGVRLHDRPARYCSPWAIKSLSPKPPLFVKCILILGFTLPSLVSLLLKIL